VSKNRNKNCIFKEKDDGFKIYLIISNAGVQLRRISRIYRCVQVQFRYWEVKAEEKESQSWYESFSTILSCRWNAGEQKQGKKGAPSKGERKRGRGGERKKEIWAEIKSQRKRRGIDTARWAHHRHMRGPRRDRSNGFLWMQSLCAPSKDVTADSQRQIRPSRQRDFNGTSILILHSTSLDQPRSTLSATFVHVSAKYRRSPFRLHFAIWCTLRLRRSNLSDRRRKLLRWKYLYNISSPSARSRFILSLFHYW